MGTVFRALDTVLAQPVALKVLSGGQDAMVDRFLREARLLAEIEHPAVVRYVAQGAEGASLWLAMEWLEGLDLAERLAKGPLGVRSVLQMAHRAAEGLAKAHAAGVVHRDVKPSNLYLVEGDPARTKLIDFGVARTGGRTKHLTTTGQFVGTAGYMAPEQIVGEREVDARADVFSLGCVLFEALTGRPAFPGDSIIAVLAKVLKDDPPRASELEPRTPRALDDLIASMLAKKPGDRPDDAARVVELLRLVEESGDAAELTLRRVRVSVTGREQRLVSAILVALEPGARLPAEALQRAAEVGAERTEVAEGVHMFILQAGGSAGDQAARAAVCALSLARLLPTATVTLGTGLAEASSELPVGPAIDRCAMLLDQSSSSGRIGGQRVASEGVAIDEVTEGLLGDRFEIDSRDGRRVLVGTRAAATAPGVAQRAAPFVGRDKELVMLEASFEEAMGEPVARSVLVVGAPGAGKSRLLREFLARATATGEARVIAARGDIVGAGSALSLARQLLRSAAGVREGEAAHDVGEKLDAYLATRFDGASLGRARAFLGELLSAESGAAPVPELVAAHNEPRVLAEWLRRSFVEWLRREAAAGPTLIVLDDLQWGDVVTVSWIGEALRGKPEMPVLVVALARPEVHTTLPDLREMLDLQELRLAGLTRRAAEQLVRASLGPDTSPAAIARIVEHAEGNPFFVEELVRRTKEDRSDAAPETVLAVVQSRFGKLDTDVRRVLRAASVFGRTFWREAIRGLVGAPSLDVLDEQLAMLERQEIIERAPEGKFAATSAWSFRHDLLRDAAYAMLTPEDRTVSHQRAAEWLEAAGERDAITLADHWQRAGDHRSAARWLLRAAEAATEVASFREALRLVDRALDVEGLDDAQRGALRVVEAVSSAFLQDWLRASRAGHEALALVAPGTVLWFRAMGLLGFATASIGDYAALERLVGSVRAMHVDPEPTGPYGFALYTLVSSLGIGGRADVAEELLRRMAKDAPLPDFGFVGWRSLARAHAALFTRQSPGDALRFVDEARRFAPGLDAVYRMASTYYFVAARLEIGDYVASERAAQRLVSDPETRAVPFLVGWATHALARVALAGGRFDEATALAERLRTESSGLINQRGTSLLAQIHLAAGRLDEARAIATEACERISTPADTASALFVRARVGIARAELEQAAADVERARSILGTTGSSPNLGSTLHNVEAELALARGELELAREIVTRARARIHRLGERIVDPALALCWRKRAVESARTEALAEQLLGDTVLLDPADAEVTAVVETSWLDEPTSADDYGLAGDEPTLDILPVPSGRGPSH